MSLLRAFATVASVIATAGCASASGDEFLQMFDGFQEVPASVEGTFHGDALTVASVLSARPVLQGESLGLMILADKPGLCDAFEEGRILPDMRYVVIQAFNYVDEELYAPAAPGEFTVVPEPPSGPAQSFVTYYRLLGCDIDETVDLATGTVTLDSVESGLYAGSFQGTTPFAETVSGWFAPTRCDAAAAAFLYGTDCE